MNRYSPIDPTTLKMLTLVEIPDVEALIIARMTEVKSRWSYYSPPLGAEYDVDTLEFDPIKISQEAGAAAELNALSFINSMGKATTLAWAVGSDLDALASRYPNGVPRLQTGVDAVGNPIMETDDRYRQRIWLSPNAFSTAGAGAAYVFEAMTAVPQLHDVTAIVTRDSLLDEPAVVITCLADMSLPGVTSPIPTDAQLTAVLVQLSDPDIGTLTDVLSVQAANVVLINFSARIWFYTNADQASALAAVNAALAALVKTQYYLGFSNTLMAFYGACNQYGVSQAIIDSPTQDTIVDETAVVIVQSVTVTPQTGTAFGQNLIVVAGQLGSMEGADVCAADGTVV